MSQSPREPERNPASMLLSPEILPVPLAPKTRSLAGLEIPPEVVRSLPAEFAERHRILPLELRNGIIRIATADRGNQRVVDDIRLLTGLEVQECEFPAHEILEKIAECYQVTVEKMIEKLSPEH